MEYGIRELIKPENRNDNMANNTFSESFQGKPLRIYTSRKMDCHYLKRKKKNRLQWGAVSKICVNIVAAPLFHCSDELPKVSDTSL
jgi:hypothetical protein